MKRFISLLLLLSIYFPLVSQFRDTVSINKNLRYSDKLLEENIDLALAYIKKSENSSKAIKYTYGVAKANLQIVRYYLLKGLNDSACYFTDAAIKYARITKDIDLIINAYLLSSRALSSALKYNKALELCLLAQRYAESKSNIKFKIKIAHDLGYIHSNMNLHEKAILYYEKGLQLSEKDKDTFNIANISARLAGEFSIMKKFDTAMFYNKQSLNYFTLIKHKRGIGVSLVNLAENYNGLKQYDKAIKTTLEAIKIRSELGDSYALTILKNNLASSYLKKNDLDEALVAAKEGEKLSIQQKDIALQIDNCGIQYMIYYHLNNFKKAFEYAFRYINLKDSVNQSSNLAALTELQTRYETEQKEKEIKLLLLENKNAEERSIAESTKRNIILFSVTSGLLLVMIFAGFMYNRFRATQKQKLIIEQKENETREQKNLIEEKQKEIVDSITYAKRLQDAILPPQEFIKTHLPNHFIIYQPKDIVAGDFYWAEEKEGKFFIAAADCTGHGVPGAMVSVVCSNALNRCVNEFGIYDAGKILDKTRNLVIETFAKSNTEVKDGMDISLLCIDKESKKVFWSGANNPLWYIENGELKELKADKQPIGKTDNAKPFTTNELNFVSGTCYYLFTDGLADQFGGPKGKKFKYRQMEEILRVNHQQKIDAQKQILAQAFAEWKGDLEQVDDVCVIGVKI